MVLNTTLLQHNPLDDYDIRCELINRILAGYSYLRLHDEVCKVFSPTTDLIHRANFFRQEVVDRHKYDDWLSKEQAEFIPIKLGRLPLDYKEKTESVHKDIDNLKVQLFNYSLNSKKQQQARKSLAGLRKKLERYSGEVERFKSQTLDGFADFFKSDYIVTHSVLNENGRPVLTDNSVFFDFCKAVKHINNLRLGQLAYRKLARNEPWRSFWNCNRENSLGVGVANWTEEQRNLVNFSKMYDRVYESPDSPADSVIDDDDMLDGWFIHQRRKFEDDKKRADAEKRFGKKDHGEYFSIVETDEDIKNVFSLNDSQSQGVLKERAQLIKSKGKVREEELPDQKRKLQMQSNQAFKEHARKGK